MSKIVESNPIHIMPMHGEITKEDIEAFFAGSDPMEHIVSIELGYNDAMAEIVYNDENNVKRITKQEFKPFVWAKNSACVRLFDGDRNTLRKKMREYGISVKPLYTAREDNTEIDERLYNGYKYLFYATHKMSFGKFAGFFSEGGKPLKPKKKSEEEPASQEYMYLQPVEQFMIESGKRYFKGYEKYDDLKRMTFDLETEGLDSKVHHISQIGIRTNKDFQKLISITGDDKETKEKNELKAIDEFCYIVGSESPDVLFGHNSENFDIPMLIDRAKYDGADFTKMSGKYLRQGIYKQKHPTVLKLGGEVETYYATVMKYGNVVDSLHAVRRAMATDSSFEKASVKYASNYLHIKKKNRVYVPGGEIDKVWLVETPDYAFNDEDGDWFKPSDAEWKNGDGEYEYAYITKMVEVTKMREDIHPGDIVNDENGNKRTLYEEDCQYTIKEKQESLKYKRNLQTGVIYNLNNEAYEMVSGKYIVERYLQDDLYETDKVELVLHETDFHITKMLPTTFPRVCTMGTATQWKLIMLTWAFQHNLAVPALGTNRKFTGGLSRLLITGFLKRIVKLDYNSLYPTTQITWNIESEVDIMHVMLKLLGYVLLQREHYKDLKKSAAIKAEDLYNILKDMSEDNEGFLSIFNEREVHLAAKASNDNQQGTFKKFGNSYFGSYGCPSVFPWASLIGAEKTTCCGRMLLRVMISHFSKLGYTPVVGDSVTGDTPLFIRKGNFIDIMNIADMMDHNGVIQRKDGGIYDYNAKHYQVLCRNGWSDVNYIYEHETKKDIYRVKDGDCVVDVTSDHSLFNDKQEEIKPTEITPETSLEYNKNNIYTDFNIMQLRPLNIEMNKLQFMNKKTDSIPSILNAKLESKKIFMKGDVDKIVTLENGYSKKAVASVRFIKKCIEANE